MKVSFKMATGLALTVGALACGSAAQAGEGGAAGSVSIRFGSSTVTAAGGPFPIGTPYVDRLSSSVAVGKNFGLATALTQTGTAGETRTSAVGAAGSAGLTNANTATAAYTYVAEGATVGTNQANGFGAGGQTNLAPLSGVTLP